MNEKKIALVTGANRGIGLEICRQLIRENIFVILTARDESKGKAAAKSLNENENSIIFHQLDLVSNDRILNIEEFVKSKFGRIDILINNAGILIDENQSALEVNMDIIKNTFESNLIGPYKLIQSFIPLMKKNNYGRIVNMSSGMGAFNEMNGGYAGYRISKTALNAMTKILASELVGTNILINTMSPGWVKTDMGGEQAPRSVEEGADTAVWLSKLPDGGPSGKFFRDRTEIPW